MNAALDGCIGRRALSCSAAALLACASVGCKDEVVERSAPPSDPKVERRAAAPPDDRSKELGDAFGQLRRTPGDFLVPAKAERVGYVDWLGHLTASIDDSRLPQRAPPPGFDARFVAQGRLWLISEKPGVNRGAGALALRVAPRSKLILQAPHTFFDEGTLPLALTVFESLEAQALMINTVHRAGSKGGKQERAERVRTGEAPADLAHHLDTFYQDTHTALLESWAGAHVVQLHGFRDEQAPGVSIIVSAAGTAADPNPVARALNDTLGAGTARIYPDEVKKLGGMTNVQAKVSRAHKRAFLHIELSATLRTQLARQPSSRVEFAQALARGLMLK
jgi:hypothetical protein